MKLNKIEITCSKLIANHLFWLYLTIIVGFNEIGNCRAAVVDTPKPTLSSQTFNKPTVTSASYVRKSRDTAGLSPTSAPESMDGGHYGGLPSSSSLHFPNPSFKHKYQTRMARFHDQDAPATRTYSIRSMTSFPKLSPLASIMRSSEVNRHPSTEDVMEDETQDPTFTPFISARALSNIPQFFQHLRDNLEALQLEDQSEENEHEQERVDRLLGQSGNGMYLYGNEDEDEEGRLLNIPRPQEKPMRWMPVTAGMTGRAHIRHFVANPEEPDLFYRKPAIFNPARNVYEFGLG